MNGKWIGAILVIAGSAGFGFALTLENGREIRMLRQFLRALAVMENELRYRLTPLPQLVSRGALETSGVIRRVLDCFAFRLESQTLPDPYSCMSDSITPDLELPPGIRKLLYALSRSLGEFDLPGQLNALEALKKDAGDKLKQLESNRVERWRCWRTLAICAGLSLAVILL